MDVGVGGSVVSGGEQMGVEMGGPVVSDDEQVGVGMESPVVSGGEQVGVEVGGSVVSGGEQQMGVELEGWFGYRVWSAPRLAAFRSFLLMVLDFQAGRDRHQFVCFMSVERPFGLSKIRTEFHYDEKME